MVSLLISGCGKGDDDLPPPPASPGSISLDSGASAAAIAANPALDVSASEPPPPGNAVDFTSISQRPLNTAGKSVSDLEYLNQLLELYQTARYNYVPNPESAPYRNDEEREIYEAKLAQLREKLRKPVTDINDLVKGGYIKAIPPAPAGQKYAINPTSQKVELVAQ